MIYRIIYLNTLTGEQGALPDLGITNSGGTVGPTFYVGGKPLLFADGTATDGSNVSVLGQTLQGVYDNSSPATINLSSGKPFTLFASNSKIFQVDPSTGKVTITGDLEVLGSSTVIDGVLTNVDQVSVNPPNGSTSALLIEPMTGVVMTTDLVRVRAINAGTPAFVIDSSGTVSAGTLTVNTINGVNFNAFNAAFNTHVSLTDPAVKHTAAQISVNEAPLVNVSGSNVQAVLESIDSTLTAAGATIKTYEHVQVAPALLWTIVHNKNSMRPTVSIYDNGNDLVWADRIHILDSNTIEVHFNTAINGRAIILLF